jgi:hypothetical protein
MKFTLHVRKGLIAFVYSDQMHAALDAIGPSHISRVSHVEPHPTKPGWTVDMSPVESGYVIGKNGTWFIDVCGWGAVEPFPSRQEALAAERAFLDAGGLNRFLTRQELDRVRSDARR